MFSNMFESGFMAEQISYSQLKLFIAPNHTNAALYGGFQIMEFYYQVEVSSDKFNRVLNDDLFGSYFKGQKIHYLKDYIHNVTVLEEIVPPSKFGHERYVFIFVFAFKLASIPLYIQDTIYYFPRLSGTHHRVSKDSRKNWFKNFELLHSFMIDYENAGRLFKLLFSTIENDTEVRNCLKQ